MKVLVPRQAITIPCHVRQILLQPAVRGNLEVKRRFLPE
jgi:hypothetical protein